MLWKYVPVAQHLVNVTGVVDGDEKAPGATVDVAEFLAG